MAKTKTKKKATAKVGVPAYISLANVLKLALQKHNFAFWLNSKKPGSLVGVCGDPEKCGIAAYLKAVIPGCSPTVNSSDISVDLADGYANIDTPAWAETFIRKFDSIGGEVTAAQACPLLGKKAA